MTLDPHAQPAFRALNAARLNDRMIDELIGLCRGVLFDGEVTEGEARALLGWLEANREISDHWPANVLYRRIARMMEDDHLDLEEQRELLECLMEITGDPTADPAARSGSASLPLCQPPPPIVFDGRVFCFTGKFVSGTRKQVQSAVMSLGADVTSNPTRRTSYLVIGAVGSTDWIHSTHGRKIERAVDLRDSGAGIQIVAEEHWVECVPVLVGER